MRKTIFSLITAGLVAAAVPAVVLSAGSASAATIPARTTASVATTRVAETATPRATQVSPDFTICYTTHDDTSATSTCVGTDLWYQILQCTDGEYHESRDIAGTGGITQKCENGNYESAEVQFINTGGGT